jgi:uncharacterized protein YyaL (SSP411 family)
MADNQRTEASAERVNRLLQVDVKNLPSDGGSSFNRLIFATSPYLLQHAENPVDWYQWGDEAFTKAALEDKPIFLSIGYSTCHWCHVMAHESFEDPEVAAMLNRDYIAIKVDREERPDIDSQYMMVAQMITGGGGWPLNIFMTPDRRPFYAVTYLPRYTSRGAVPGITEMLEKISDLWRRDRQTLERSAKAVIDALTSSSHEFDFLPGEELMAESSWQLERIYDKKHGGFGMAPKFPMPVYISFLLQYGVGKEPRWRDMALHTLQSIRKGGIYDQIGGGIHRYSVDERWLVPHFEKMLYDQALMARAFFEAFQVTADRFYLAVGEEICAYVGREMTSPNGGFYAGQDADTEGEEGAYYLWTPGEVSAVVGENEAPSLCRSLGITSGGNFAGKSVPHIVGALESGALQEEAIEGTSHGKFAHLCELLLQARMNRPRPFRDEKIITGWNGLMIATCARSFA